METCLSMLYWWGGKLRHMSASFIIIHAAQFPSDSPTSLKLSSLKWFIIFQQWFKEYRYFENSCEALYRILETVCHKNSTIVTYFSVQLMVILILHMCSPYSQHKVDLVHSQNHSRGKSDGVHPYGCTHVWEIEWMCARGVLFMIRSSLHAHLWSIWAAAWWLGCVQIQKKCQNNALMCTHVAFQFLFLSLICAYSLSMLHFLFLSLHEALKSRCYRYAVGGGCSITSMSCTF